MKYIVLLRGINISGKNKISMSELKNKLENLNYENVITYLNSGNIILETNQNKDEIVMNVHTMIKNEFNLDIPVFVINKDELEDLLNNKPNWWIKTASSEVKDFITIRTKNTVKKLLEMSRDK